jgi:hypothetical protein
MHRIALAVILLMILVTACGAAGPVTRVAFTPSAVSDEGYAPGSDRSWPQSTREIIATPIFADLTGDGIPEVIAADDMYIYAYSLSGTLLWSQNIGNVQMHAAVADVDGDGHAEVAITSTLPTARLWVLNGATGSPKSGWPVNVPIVTFTNLTCPVIVDLNGDGHLDVGTAGEEGVFFYDRNGVPLPGWPLTWSVPINNPQWSAPAVGDVDHDGSLEVAVGNVCYPNWGVYLIRSNGTVMPGWPKVIKPVYSSPALADLDGDGTLEIIAQEGDPGSQGSRLWVWHYDGTAMTGWPRTIAAEGNSSRCNPAVADVQGDGIPEIVTFTGDSKLHIFLPSGLELAGYPKTVAGVQHISSPSVVDVNNDGLEEIFETYWLSSAQYVSGWDLAGNVLSGFPKSLYSPSDLNSHSSTHIMDADGDGVFEMAVAGSDMNGHGRVYVFDVDGSIATPSSRMDWPKIRQDVMNHGRYTGINPADVALGTDLRVTPFRVAPNPIFAHGRIALHPPEGQAGSVTICDPAGRVIGRRMLTGSAVLPVRDLLGGDAARGVYFIRWQPLADGVPRTARIVVGGE